MEQKKKKKKKKKPHPSSWISDDEKAAEARGKLSFCDSREAREGKCEVLLYRLDTWKVKKERDWIIVLFNDHYLDLDHSLPFKAKQYNEWNYELRPHYFDICYAAYKLVCNNYNYCLTHVLGLIPM